MSDIKAVDEEDEDEDNVTNLPPPPPLPDSTPNDLLRAAGNSKSGKGSRKLISLDKDPENDKSGQGSGELINLERDRKKKYVYNRVKLGVGCVSIFSLLKCFHKECARLLSKSKGLVF